MPMPTLRCANVKPNPGELACERELGLQYVHGDWITDAPEGGRD